MQSDSIKHELIAWISRLEDQGMLKALWGLKKLLQGSRATEALSEEERQAIASRIAVSNLESDRNFWQQIAETGLERSYAADEPDISGITLLEPNPDYGK